MRRRLMACPVCGDWWVSYSNDYDANPYQLGERSHAECRGQYSDETQIHDSTLYVCIADDDTTIGGAIARLTPGHPLPVTELALAKLLTSNS